MIVDCLVVSAWSRPVFEQMHKGGLTLVNQTCGVWENFYQSVQRIAVCKKAFEENSDLIMQVYKIDDVMKARDSGRVGVVLGWQNTSGIEDQIPFLTIFHELGVRVMQLTYNTQNLVGSGCYEAHDGGLSGFGREVVEEMNRLGIVIDLSHVGARTAQEAIIHSEKPVCYSHVAPFALKAHPRCKTDEQLRFIADRGGFIGGTVFPPFMKNGPDTTIDDYIDMLDHMIGIAGEQQIGIGTDFCEGELTVPDEYWVRDKGYARTLVDFGVLDYPSGFQSSADYGNLARAMERRGWSSQRISRVMGENWLSFLRRVWDT